MMSKKIFEIIERALKHVKRIDDVFGGMQVIFTGDFFQLPPIGNPYDEDTCCFCFESAIWRSAFTIDNHVVLKHIFRQNDGVYKDILNQIRWGELDENATAILMKCVKRPIEGDIIPTKLFAVRAKTDFVNSRMYEKIEGEESVYMVQSKSDLKTYIESGKPIEIEHISVCVGLSKKDRDDAVDRLVESTNRSKELRLKKGARVMCLHNICVDDGICNGSQGVVVDFADSNKAPVVLFSNGKKMLIEPVWVQSDDYPCIGIGQIPLCLAWALTIHKIQGATLAMAEMDLGDSVFEYGQTYVALSRIKDLDGLYLSAFQPRKIKANPIVKEFYRGIPDWDYEIPENIFREFEMKEDPNIKVIRL